MYILPALLFMAALIFYPIVYSFILSMQKVEVTTLMQAEKEWVWFRNYKKIFASADLWNALRVTLVFTAACIFFQFTIGFLLALLFKRTTRIFKFMKAVMLVPYIIPATASAILFKFFFATDGGIINELLLFLGVIQERISWLIRPDTALVSVITANIWSGIPFNMILLSTGLANIPEDFYESAEIDGANFLQKFIYITVPSLMSSIKAVLVLGVVYTFRCFEQTYVMTSGGPVGGTTLMTIYSYKKSFVEFKFSEGAAITNVLFIVLFLVGLFYIRMIGKDEEM